jgi:hypothetical protein
MPGWTEDEAADYWDATDLYERANGRLYISADFALPRELDSDDQIALAHAFAQELTGHEQLPYTLAIHAGRDTDGREHNPHAHIMISERQNDGIARPREQWFRRANPTDPGRGGAPKSRTFHGHEWMEKARERWASLVNEKLRECGRAERVDHRSYERQGIDREPGRLTARLLRTWQAEDSTTIAWLSRLPPRNAEMPPSPPLGTSRLWRTAAAVVAEVR